MRSELQLIQPFPSSPRLSAFIFIALPFLLAGCGEEPRNVGAKPGNQASGKPTVPPKLEPILGKRTQEIANANVELKNQGATVATTKITARDPITLPGNAYVTIIGRTSILNIQHALDLYHAENDRYPKNYDEFMNDIIKANNIALPKLPNYQKYGYDEKEHKLLILEYEDIKNQPLGGG